jgi:2-amino-4-hydroxy-6-hydroxymethyldihydropteridine diphosphokinase
MRKEAVWTNVFSLLCDWLMLSPRSLAAAAGINDPGYSVSAMSKRAAIALGSNLGDRLANLQSARDRIRALDGMTEPTVQSAVYETSPVDCEPGAQNFYNAVIEIGFEKSADVLFEALQKIEQALGRERNHERDLSRTIDLDLLYFGSERRDDALLQLPHPRMTERKFVLQPLCDIAPDLRLPGQTKNVGELLAQLQDQGKITRLTENW